MKVREKVRTFGVRERSVLLDFTQDDYLKSYARVTSMVYEGMLGTCALSAVDKVSLSIALGAMQDNCMKFGFRDVTEFLARAGDYHRKESARRMKKSMD